MIHAKQAKQPTNSKFDDSAGKTNAICNMAGPPFPKTRLGITPVFKTERAGDEKTFVGIVFADVTFAKGMKLECTFFCFFIFAVNNTLCRELIIFSKN